MPSNDNHPLAAAGGTLPDPQAQAALLLIESLIHGLVERSVLTLEDGVDIVETAIDVQADVAREAPSAGAQMWQAHALLTQILDSLQCDVPDR